MSNILPLSFSRINTFKRCKRKFYYRYIERLKEEEESEALKLGKLVHTALEKHVMTETRRD